MTPFTNLMPIRLQAYPSGYRVIDIRMRISPPNRPGLSRTLAQDPGPGPWPQDPGPGPWPLRHSIRIAARIVRGKAMSTRRVASPHLLETWLKSSLGRIPRMRYCGPPGRDQWPLAAAFPSSSSIVASTWILPVLLPHKLSLYPVRSPAIDRSQEFRFQLPREGELSGLGEDRPPHHFVHDAVTIPAWATSSTPGTWPPR